MRRMASVLKISRKISESIAVEPIPLPPDALLLLAGLYSMSTGVRDTKKAPEGQYLREPEVNRIRQVS